jgi:uncharacterized protein YaiI (UPF0178 family)
MEIFVDADACPIVCKEILFRMADRLQLKVTLVANQLIQVPGSRFIRALQVPAGADVADLEIVRLLSAGDLVVTADIPLASLVLEKGGYALNPRGEFYTNDNIAQHLSMRAFLDELRGSGSTPAGRRRTGRPTARILPTSWTATCRGRSRNCGEASAGYRPFKATNLVGFST